MKYIKLFLLAILLYNSQTFGKIRIVCTAALINDGFELRKKEYIEALEILKNYGYPDCYIVEAVLKQGPSFLDDYSNHVFYSSMNNSILKNKGINEGKTLLEGLKHFNFDPEDMIIKVTGRYIFTSDQFLKIVQNNPAVDAVVKSDGGPGIITGCFALKYKYLLQALESFDYNLMEKEMLCIEWKFNDFLKKIALENNAKVLVVNNLDLKAHVWGNAGYKPGVMLW